VNYRIYRNLTHGCWSLQTMTENGWRVTAHLDHILAWDCTFKVSQAGRDRVRQEGRKNVHAFVEASKIRVLRSVAELDDAMESRLTYNPYDDVPGFHGKWYSPDRVVSGAGEVELRPDGTIHAWMLQSHNPGVATAATL
jgi:hypothetical protein